MAENAPYNDAHSFQTGEARVNIGFTCTTAGAVPSTLDIGAGVTSVVLSGTGVYTIVTKERYARFFGLTINNIIQASYSASGACAFKITSFDLSTNTVVLTAITAAGAAVTPLITDVVRIELKFSIYPGEC